METQTPLKPRTETGNFNQAPDIEPGSAPLRIHSFGYEARWFAFDPASCSYFEINEVTHDVIQALVADESAASGHGGSAGAKSAALNNSALSAAKERHGQEAVLGSMLDLENLRDNGYFAREEPESAEETERYVNALVPQASASIKLDISEACNLACRYCYAEGGSFGHEPRLMSKEVAQKAIDLVFERSARLKTDYVGIIFLGGEPLVNLDVIKFVIEYSQGLGKEQGKRVAYSMTTNATLMSDEIIELITKYRIGIKVSIDGKPKVHDYLRPYKHGGGTFQDIVANLRRLVARRGYPPAVRAVITKNNLNLNEVSEYLEQIGFNIIGFGYAEGNCYEKGDLDLQPEDWEYLKSEERGLGLKVLDKLDRGETVKFNPYGRLLQKIHHRTKTKMRCGYARGTITVAADGRIYPCPLSPGKRDPYVIGDVHDGIDLTRVKAMVADYYKVKKHCDKVCWANNICGGPCPTYVAHESGRHIAPDPVHCDFVRSGYEFGVWLYQELKERHPDYLKLMLENPA